MAVEREPAEAGQRWDKIKAWGNVQHDITKRLKAPEKFDQSMTLYHGPQLFHTLRNPAHIKCMTHFRSNIGDVFMTHYRLGTVDTFNVWNLESMERDAAVKHQKYEIKSEVSAIMFVPKHRVYLAFCTDLVLRVYTDAKSKCSQIGAIPCGTTILCMTYNKDTDEVYVGGKGLLENWSVSGSEHSAVARRECGFETELENDEWVIDIKVDSRNQQLLALCYDGIYVVSYQTMKQTHLLQNRHDGSLRCCSLYKEREYFITGGGDGLVKVWNSVVFTQVHVFYGHRDAITSLQVHGCDPLLFSASLDGSIQIWRMDNFSKFMRLDLGMSIYQMKLLGDEEFFCQTEKEIRIYNLNQFYDLFAPVESSVYKLQLCQGTKEKPSRVIASTEDGSVRFFSPVTGTTITIIYPMPTLQVLTSFAYNKDKDKMMTVLHNGDVLVFNCETNPSKAEELWQPVTHDEAVTSIVLVSLAYEGKENTKEEDTVIFGGLRNGQISLLDATNCVMVKNLQAHEDAVTCMEFATELDDSGFQMLKTSKTLVTGGQDSFLKIWSIHVKAAHTGDKITLDLLLKIHCASKPKLASMYENTLCVALEETEGKGCLQMYRLDGRDPENKSASVQYAELHHSADEEHTNEITALDKCPLLGLFATASLDGYIKIWNRHNQLLREMSFGEPLHGLCFANARGDLLVGFQNHVCSIPLTNFFPQNILERIAFQEFKDDLRESSISFNSKVKPWFDPKKLPKFSTTHTIRTQEKRAPDIKEDIVEDLEDRDSVQTTHTEKRKQEKQRLEKEILKKLEQRRQSLNEADLEIQEDLGLPLTTPELSAPGDGEQVEDRTEDELEETESGLLTDRGYMSEGAVDEDFEVSIDLKRRKFVRRRKKSTKMDKKEREERNRRKSMVTPVNIHLLSPLERALLKRKPIIPLDGYIPNSVIRKQLGLRPPTPPPFAKPKELWKPKPVPQALPHHMPEEEEEPMDLYEIAARYRLFMEESDDETFVFSESEEEEQEVPFERPCHGGRRGQKREKREISEDSDLEWSEGEDIDDGTDGIVDNFDEFDGTDFGNDIAESLVGSEFSLLGKGKSLKEQKPLFWADLEEDKKSEAPQWKKVSTMVRTVSNLSSTSSKRAIKLPSRKSTPGTPSKYELKSKAFEFGRVDMGLGSQDALKLSRSKSGGPKSREKSKSFRLTSMVVDEDSTDVRYKEGTKSGKRKGMFNSDMEVIHKLMKEEFFRDIKGTPSFDGILQHLLTMLDTEDADLHGKVCEYILEIHKDVGISDHYLDRIINKLSHQLKGGGSVNIKRNGLGALSVIGKSRQDVVATILPRLVDSQTDIRTDAAEALANLTGVTNKEELYKLMEEMGLQKSYSSKEDEEEALKALAMRLDVPYRSDSFNSWIDNWMDEMESPGIYEMEDDLKLGDIEKAWDKGRQQRWMPESLCPTESVSRASNRLKELSFLSDKSLLLEEQLSFISFKSETKNDSVYNVSEENDEFLHGDNFADENDDDKHISHVELHIGDQILRVTSNYGKVILDDDPDAMFASLYSSDDERHTTQMMIIDQLLKDNPEFDASHLDPKSVKSDGEIRKKPRKVDVGTQYDPLFSKPAIPSTISEEKTNSDGMGSGTGSRSAENYGMETRVVLKGKWTPTDLKKGLDRIQKEAEPPPPPSRASSKQSQKTSSSTHSSERDDWFDPRDPNLYRYYKNRYGRPGTGGRPAGHGFKFPQGSLQKFGKYLEDTKSQQSSQGDTEGVDTLTSNSQMGDTVEETMSAQDSGIVRDLSISITSRSDKAERPVIVGKTSSHSKGGRRSKKSEWSRSQLSPVKSSSSVGHSTLSSPKTTPRNNTDWQKFFNTPTALERKRMEMVKRDFSEGKVKHAVPATIHYIANGIPMLPGEAGLRLLHTVKVGDSKALTVTKDGRHRIEPIPGKLSTQTKNENHGQSSYGILKMQWTTDVPISFTPGHYHMGERAITCSDTLSEMTESYRSRDFESVSERSHDQPVYPTPASPETKPRLPRLTEKSFKKYKKYRPVRSEDYFTLPNLPGSVVQSPDFVWEHPMPPPPPRESRTNVAYIKKEHDKYCKYYDMVKKNMQKYTSMTRGGDTPSKTPSLPEVEIKQAFPSPRPPESLNLSRGPSLIFPPITLNQLISGK